MSDTVVLSSSPITKKSTDFSDDSERELALARQAKENLNYNEELSDSAQELRDARLHNRMVEVFDELGIQPFDPENVESYKAKKKEELDEAAREVDQFMDIRVFFGVALLFSALAFLVLAGFVLAGDLPSYSLVLGAIPLYFWYKHRQANSREKPRFNGEKPNHLVWSQWEETRLSQFDGQVPDSTLAKALALKEKVTDKVPEAEFYVSQLQQKAGVSHPDPFLLIRAGENVYYIDVWDEPGFGE